MLGFVEISRQSREALEVLDPYGEGMVTFDDFRLAVEPGESLREMLDEQLHADGNASASNETGFGFNPWVDLWTDGFCF